MDEELAKRTFDQQAVQNVSGNNFYKSYCDLKQDNEHLSTLILNRIRKWLGLRGLINQDLVSRLRKRLSDGDIACIFQSINKIPAYFLPHFRNAITFCKEKIPRGRIPLPDAFSHRTALMIHSFVHPEIRPMMPRLVSEDGNGDQIRDWERVMNESNRLASQFSNPFSDQYPELWGIDPSYVIFISLPILSHCSFFFFRKGLFTDVVTMHESYFSLKFQLKDVLRTGRSQLDPMAPPQLPTDEWIKSALSRSQQRHWELVFYAWLSWKEHFRDEQFHWLSDFTYHQDLPRVRSVPLNNSLEGRGAVVGDANEEMLPVEISVSSATNIDQLLSSPPSDCQLVDPPLGSISELCSIQLPLDDPPSLSPPASPPLAPPRSPGNLIHDAPLDPSPDLPNEIDNFPPPHSPPPSPSPRGSSPLSHSSSSCEDQDQPAAELELLQTKAQYLKLKNARRVLRDLRKGRLDESLFSADELRELRKRCYQAMVDG
jgi:hypothetical protein